MRSGLQLQTGENAKRRPGSFSVDGGGTGNQTWDMAALGCMLKDERQKRQDSYFCHSRTGLRTAANGIPTSRHRQIATHATSFRLSQALCGRQPQHDVGPDWLPARQTASKRGQLFEHRPKGSWQQPGCGWLQEPSPHCCHTVVRHWSGWALTLALLQAQPFAFMCPQSRALQATSRQQCRQGTKAHDQAAADMCRQH